MSDWDAYYRTRFQFHPQRSVVWKCICEWLQPEIPEVGTVVEFGAGYCDFINNIRAARKVAVDVSSIVAREATPGVETHIGSCTDCSFLADSSVDTVFTSNLLEHLTLPQAEETLREAGRLLKSNGKLIIVQPNFRYCYRDYFDDYTHITIFTDTGLADFVCSIGFNVLRLEPRFMPFSMKGNLPIAPWLIRLYLRSPLKPRAGQMLLIAGKEV
jgi:SAM-dependent methyltransferase